MNRTIISRFDLKKNFLKEIIVRLDFQGVLQAEMEKILLIVKPYLKENSFNRYEEKVINQISNDDSNFPDIKSQVVYTFIAEGLGYKLDLSNTSIILSVHSQSYSPFDNYSKLFCRIATIYKESIDFFTEKRFGIRKINFCFIRNREEINRYFNSSYYSCDIPIEGYASQSKEQIDRLSDGVTKLNLRYAIEEGRLGDEQIYKVTLDSDIYLTEQASISNTIYNDTEMQAINEKLFGIYINVLTDEFIAILADENVNNDSIIGVELNE